MLMADPKRLLDRIEKLAQFGGSDQGMNRFAYTPEEAAALAYLKNIFAELELDVWEDPVGNVFARYAGKNPELKPLVAGSHIDTVRNGGKYDGALGVLAALETVQVMKENSIRLNHPLDVFISKDEEGTRFNATLFGTAALIGHLTDRDLAKVDAEGISVAQAMTAMGYAAKAYRTAQLAQGDLAAYLELHIEQGKILESDHIDIGIVTGIAGPLWFNVKVSGEAGHAGATPMRIRRDPMVAAARLIAETDRIVRQFPHTVATTGQMKVTPGSTNVIPAEVEYTIDLRDVDMAHRNQAEAQIREAAGRIMAGSGVAIELTDLVRVASVPSEPRIMAVIEEAASQIGLKSRRMPSGAGHDAMYLGKLCPFGMIFVPSVKGYSHRSDEYTSIEDCVHGVNTLIQTLVKLDTIL